MTKARRYGYTNNGKIPEIDVAAHPEEPEGKGVIKEFVTPADGRFGAVDPVLKGKFSRETLPSVVTGSSSGQLTLHLNQPIEKGLGR